MMGQKPHESGCRGKGKKDRKGKRKRLILNITRAVRSNIYGLSWGAFCTQKTASCIVCIVESLHEVAMDNNEMHENGVGSEIYLACGGGANPRQSNEH